jgi:hypothetical protein
MIFLASHLHSRLAFVWEITHNHQENLMTYLEKLNPWCIVRLLPNMQNRIVARFRRRSDAEAHLQVLRRLIPNVSFKLIFDVALEQQDLTA